ncbi:phage tail length tape measure family protein [Sinorhizobium meliloti]|uniref:phage tail length tape measure family protein n=1 Tax=Rhizobium meliloti TaxID=382 RepID=UPI002091E55C|nr:phage tail length tape measure family protein [Sinorhizobium meliloti]MCO5962367.1 phage tail length tape measure family protein [Sinorhizobium meliloti]
MADVATLGLQVESGSVEKGTDALNKLTGAAARAEAAANGLSGANRGATGAASAAAKAYAAEGAAAASASKQIEMMNRAANQNRASTRGNLGNIAAQFQDIAVSAQMGMGPLQIALQQGTQLAAVLSSMERPVQGLGAAFLSVLSPVSLLTIGIIALAAAGLQMVDWARLAQSALITLADVLETIAPYAVAAASALALIYAPTIIGGIISLIALLGRLVVQLGIVAGAFALANPVVAFVAGITAAVAAAIVFRDELKEIFGRDIVADAKNGINAVIGAFIGGYEAIKAVWGRLPAAISDFVYSTAKKVVDGIESMVQKVVDGLNNLVNKYALWTASIGRPLSPETYNRMIIGPVDFESPENPNAGALGSAMKAAQDAYNSAQGTDYVGKGIQAIGEYASTAAGKIKDLAKGLADVDEKAKKRSGGKSEQEKYADIVAGAERQIAALEAERDAIGLTEQAAAALRYETQLLNEAQQRGISLTDAQKSELSSLAQVMASIEEETRQMGIALDFARDVTGGFFDDFFSGIERGKSVWESFGNAALGVLDRIADKLLNDVLDAVFQVSGAGGVGGGLLGWLFGGGSSVDPWAGLRGYANGTSSARPGVAWVGEKGPELVRFKGGEEVIPSHRLQRPANVNFAQSAGSLAPSGPREIILRVVGEEGPMFRPTIRAESHDAAVNVVSQNNAARENLYMNGEPQYG